jgi:hypothetical protein
MSKQTITIKLSNNNGDEIEYELPAKNVVCDRCEGHGTHLNPSIGNHAYSSEEFYESFPDEEDREQYFARGGIYDVRCESCKGNNVVLIVDAEACESNTRLAPIYSAWEKQEIEAEREMADWRAEMRMESMMLGEEY